MRESVIQRAIIKFLQLRGFKVYKISDRFRAGIPDIYAAKNGWSCWLEVKAPGGRLSKLQQLELDQLQAAGIYTQVVRSVEEVEALLDRTDRWKTLREIVMEDLVQAPPHAERRTS